MKKKVLFFLLLFLLGKTALAEFRFLTVFNSDYPFDCIQFSDRTFLVASNDFSGSRLRTEKFSEDGSSRHWCQEYDLLGENNRLVRILKYPDNSFLVLRTSEFNQYIGIIKIDFLRNVVFQNTYTANSNSMAAKDMMIDSQHNIVVVGSDNNSQHGFILKIDSTGNTVWAKNISTLIRTDFYSIKQKNDSTYLIFGRDTASFIMETNLDGVVRNVHRYLTPIYDSSWHDLIQTHDNGYLLYGETINHRPGIVKIDSNYVVSWSTEIGRPGSSWDMLHKVYELNDHSFVLCCRTDTSTYLDMLIKVDDSGNHVWTKLYDGTTNSGWLGPGSGILTMLKTPGGGYVLHGGNMYDRYVLKTDENFNLGCNERSSYSQNNFLLAQQLTGNDHYQTLPDTITMTAEPVSSLPGTTANLIIVCSSNVTGIQDESSEENEIGIFPNPAFSKVKIFNAVPESRFEVNDVSGKLMISGIVTDKSPEIDLGKLNSGIYFLTIHEKGRNIHRKIVKESR